MYAQRAYARRGHPPPMCAQRAYGTSAQRAYDGRAHPSREGGAHDRQAHMRSTRLHLRCTDSELDGWRQAADRDERSLSDWIRHRLNGNGHEPAEAAQTEPVLAGRAGKVFRGPDPKAAR